MMDIDEDPSTERPRLEVDHNNLISAVEFLKENSKISHKDVNKTHLKDSLKIFSIMSKNGIPEEILKSIAVDVVFTNAFDASVRRTLLYCLIPEGDFPHSIIPLAVSSAVSAGSSPTAQHSVLGWLASLLEYGIIDSSNKFMHICYTALFHLLGKEKICGFVCKILYRITQRYDVSAYRVQSIKRLYRKPNLQEQLQPLLRLYKTYRPDLVIVSVSVEKKFPQVPCSMREALLNARIRIEENLEATEQDVWNQVAQIQKKKTSRSVVPPPEIYVYAATLEEKSRKKISVLQYRKIKDMAREVRMWKDWIWPNSAAALLWKPNLIPLFKPSDIEVMITITNWLEMALKTEIIDGRGAMNMKGKQTLLNVCVSLCRQTGTMVPIVYHFIGEFLVMWDRKSFMSTVLELLSCIPFTSDTYFFNHVMACLVDLFCTANLTLWCALVDALSSTACAWAFQEYKEGRFKSVGSWPLSEENLSPMEGTFYLSKRLERLLLAGLIRFGTESIIFHTCIDYYEKINLCAEELELPIYVAPPIEFTVAVIASGDVGAMHRCGVFFSKSKKIVSRISEIAQSHTVASVFIGSAVQSVNLSIEVFLNFAYSCQAFNKNWMTTLAPYFNDEYMYYLSTINGLRNCGSIAHSLSYLPVSLHVRNDKSDSSVNQIRTTIARIAELLSYRNLNGIQLCAEKFITENLESSLNLSKSEKMSS